MIFKDTTNISPEALKSYLNPSFQNFKKKIHKKNDSYTKAVGEFSFKRTGTTSAYVSSIDNTTFTENTGIHYYG